MSFFRGTCQKKIRRDRHGENAAAMIRETNGRHKIHNNVIIIMVNNIIIYSVHRDIGGTRDAEGDAYINRRSRPRSEQLSHDIVYNNIYDEPSPKKKKKKHTHS